MGIAGAGLVREIDDPFPDHLRDWWTPVLWCLHSAHWWRRHWERTGIMDIPVADTLLEDGPWMESIAQCRDGRTIPAFADIPKPREELEEGWPVMTLFCHGKSVFQCRENLRETAKQLMKVFG